MPSTDEQWLEDEAGPVVRLYPLTGGRTRPAGESIDLIATVSLAQDGPAEPPGLEPEHVTVLRRCQRPATVADLAADLNLPLGVIQILLADLRERGLILIRPAIGDSHTDLRVLEQVVKGIRRLLTSVRGTLSSRLGFEFC